MKFNLSADADTEIHSHSTFFYSRSVVFGVLKILLKHERVFVVENCEEVEEKGYSRLSQKCFKIVVCEIYSFEFRSECISS
jgi:hypothetical protein